MIIISIYLFLIFTTFAADTAQTALAFVLTRYGTEFCLAYLALLLITTLL
jgi:hypothetical protein